VIRTALSVIFISAGFLPIFSQLPEAPPKFEIADVHTSAKIPHSYFRTMPVHNRRYELKNATMVDLIRTAWDVDPDKVVGGPNWLEMNRFDLVAKLPVNSTSETQKLMLQSLLADRFNLKVHKDTRSIPAYVLSAENKPQLKVAEGKEETGCKIQNASGSPTEGSGRLEMTSADGSVRTISLSPGMVIQYNCRNMSMAAFAEGLRSMLGVSLGSNRVLDQTGLEGRWNFDLKFSMQTTIIAANNTGGRITLAEAINRQLGLKFEEKQVPAPVIVVDSINEKPSENPPGLAKILPPIPMPTEFEVASIKPTEPSAAQTSTGARIQPGGRFVAQGITVKVLALRAFNASSNDQVLGLPKWADTDRYDINAKVPLEESSTTPLDIESIEPMVRSLLVERFKMKYHTEQQPVAAYTLLVTKSKMKKADAATRTFCKNVDAPPSAPPGSRILNCQNITMAQFADRLQGLTSELTLPILDATGIEGGFSFSLTFSPLAAALRRVAERSGGIAGQAPGDVQMAADPVSGGITLFEALEKQLGLKLELQKRPMPVIVIDHIEQKPTEN
jgi:uncharacterized protein (TIGR03435 family)